MVFHSYFNIIITTISADRVEYGIVNTKILLLQIKDFGVCFVSKLQLADENML